MHIGTCLWLMLEVGLPVVDAGSGPCILQLHRLRSATVVLKWAWHGKREPGPSLGCGMGVYCCNVADMCSVTIGRIACNQ